MEPLTPPRCLVDDRRACDPIPDPRLGERLSELDYLRHVEQLANAVVDAAFDEGWYLEAEETPLQTAVNELGKRLRHVHYEGDGCLEEDRT